MYKFLRPLLFLLSPDKAHKLTLQILSCLPAFYLNYLYKKRIHRPVKMAGLSFYNPVGLAAGFDKNAKAIDALFALGFGFVEVGAVTPKPQKGNPKPHVTRLVQAQSALNRCGFNNHGLDALVKRLQKRRLQGVLGVNIGANSSTKNEDAAGDYILCMQKLYAYVDYMTINISCPNSSALVELQQSHFLDDLLKAINVAREALQEKYKKPMPLFVKVSPDLDQNAIEQIGALLIKHKMDGVITTNTTTSRDGIAHLPEANLTGGLSGNALAERSLKVQLGFVKVLNDQIPVIAVGGIDSKHQAVLRLENGASLIQLYTGLIFKGTRLIRDILEKTPT